MVQTVQRDHICHLVHAPAAVSRAVDAEARRVAMRAIEAMPGAGIYGVEMFLVAEAEAEADVDSAAATTTAGTATATTDLAGSQSASTATSAPRVLLNEIAPRPHNSGHYTQDASICCQFEQHVRAVIGAPLGPTHMSAKGGNGCGGSGSSGSSSGSGSSASGLDANAVFCTMINVLGDGSMESTMRVCARAMRVPGAHVHWCVWCFSGTHVVCLVENTLKYM